jgi:DNA-binding NarL/FixJ family response regulator
VSDHASDPVIRVFLVDDQELVRAGFTMLVDSQADMRVVGQAGDGGEALEKIQVTACDVVLMDVRMPRLDGVEATRRLQSLPEAPKVIVLTTFDLDEYVHAALRAGASGFLLKDAQPTDLLAAVHLVAAGESVLAPSLVRRLIAAYVETPATASKPAWLDSLTPREVEVLVEVARGLSNAEIGDALYMSAATAKTHVGRLLMKLNARDRTHLVIAAYEAGLVR